jgi:hypothetical protein
MLTISNSTFSSNSASGPGAISSDGTLTITNSTFSENLSLSIGAIGNGGTLTISNSTFFENFGQEDAGAIDNGGTLIVTNTTFSNNISNGETFSFPSGDINNDSGSATLKSTILTGSTNSAGSPLSNCVGTITDAGYNISDDDSCGFTCNQQLEQHQSRALQ